ncbi:MAG: hypothetical protein HQL30_03895 [Candidatus Omnitrophica bacterium]|nr:hypothetical protein [Candidatus Omnitrophota bacterium]
MGKGKKSKKIILKVAPGPKSAERIEDEKLREPVRKAIQQLRESKILCDLLPKAAVPQDPCFNEQHLSLNIAKVFVSLDKHQGERRHIAEKLHQYLDKLENYECRLIKKSSNGLMKKAKEIRVRIQICKEFLKHSQYEHKDCWKDLAYYKLFQNLKHCQKLKYNDTIAIMARLSILYRQTSVSCREDLTSSGKYFNRYFPIYSKDGKFQAISEKVRLSSDEKLKTLCYFFKNGRTHSTCCKKEKANIAKRIARVMSPKDKGLLFYDESKYGELTWSDLLSERKTFKRLYGKKMLRKVPINNIEKYLGENIRHIYTKRCLDEVLLTKILTHLNLSPQEYLPKLKSDKEFWLATSLLA